MSKATAPTGTPLTDEQRDVVAANVGLCGLVAKFPEFARSRLTFEDRVQAGVFGLARAAQLYDPARGVEFSTYAVWHVRQAIQRWERKEETIHIPHAIDSTYAFRSPKYRDARELAAKARAVASLESFETDQTLARDDPAARIERADEAAALGRAVARALGSLSARDSDVVASRLVDGETLDAVARRHRISRERVRMILVNSTRKLRRHPALSPYAKGA